MVIRSISPTTRWSWWEADEYKIFQVIYNLVNNAINYTGG